MKNFVCPSCGKNLSWGERWQFTRGWASRKAAFCPSCGSEIMRAKWPFRIMQLSSGLVLASLPFIYIETIQSSVAAGILLFLAFIGVVYGILNGRFEIQKDNQRMHSDSATPAASQNR